MGLTTWKEWLPQSWRHVFKLDPARPLPDEALEAICQSETDAIMVGGTQGVTYDNTVTLLSRIRRFSIPCALEVSTLEAVVPGFDLYFLPMVLNTCEAEWITGMHHQGIKRYGSIIPWDLVIPEGYLIGNPDAAVAHLTAAQTDLDVEDVQAYARMAEHLFGLPVLYIEFSGCYGGTEWVRAARRVLRRTQLFYGGGIQTPEQALEIGQWADTVVVGNLVYQDLGMALATARAVRSSSGKGGGA